MKQSLSDSTLARLSDYVALHMGLHLPRAKWHTLDHAFCSAAGELGFQDPEAYATRFLSAPITREHIEAMAGYLTVGETYFLRENRSFEVLVTEIIPEIIRARRGGEKRLRIWSAGCATGEEPYTIAILLQRMGALLGEWTISILATDINPQALRKAKEGVYTEWSFRNDPRWFKENYFRKTGDGRFRLISRIRKMVTFSYLNLVEDAYPSLLNDTNAIDIVLCRNVLMYLAPERARQVVERLHRSLVEGGWLVVSPCETSSILFSPFAAVSFPNAVLYQKQASSFKVRFPSDEIRMPEPEARTAALKAQDIKPERLTIQLQNPEHANRNSQPDVYGAALSLYDQGAYREAAERLSVVLSRNRDDARALTLLCRIRANEGKLSDALQLSERALAADKLSAELHYLRAIILQELGALDEAVRALKRALYLDQEMVLAHFTLGNLTLRQEKENESRKHFDHALALLDRYCPDEVLPGSEGLLAGRLMEIIRSTAVGT